jgi:hypothetical protein
MGIVRRALVVTTGAVTGLVLMAGPGRLTR